MIENPFANAYYYYVIIPHVKFSVDGTQWLVSDFPTHTSHSKYCKD